jgi:hypothetical protein
MEDKHAQKGPANDPGVPFEKTQPLRSLLDVGIPLC